MMPCEGTFPLPWYSIVYVMPRAVNNAGAYGHGYRDKGPRWEGTELPAVQATPA